MRGLAVLAGVLFEIAAGFELLARLWALAALFAVVGVVQFVVAARRFP